LGDGKMRLYQYDYWRVSNKQGTGEGIFQTGEGIFQKCRKFLVSNGTFTEVNRVNCKGDLLEFITDCPEIISRIRKKKYSFDKILFLALDYNAVCK
jgi:hypothetical protein